MPMKKFGIMLAGLALVAITPAARSETISVIVGYADLDLASTAGFARLENRVEDAATRLCGLSDRDRVMPQTKARCIRDTVNSVRPQLEALRSGRTLSSSKNILFTRSVHG
ncbi:UrcA family protein [Aurantiacibacter hainanensis]|uniref:UrcA family protein n=1 Tax=Aurantiacibacter hainanensis TaxID=3076114 RepID=UPI0030C69DAF